MKKAIAILLVLILILAMMPTPAFAAATKTITTSAQLADAIKNQQDGETWNLAANTIFDLNDALVDTYNTITINGSSHFIFPITANNLTINGDLNTTVITSSAVAPSPDTAYNWENFITLAGNNVTLNGLRLIANYNPNYAGINGVNKIIEVLGTGSTLKAIWVDPRNGGDFAGTVYYRNTNSTDTLENVYLFKGRISLTGKVGGSMKMTSVTINFVSAMNAAGFSDWLGFDSIPLGVTFLTDDVTLMMNQFRMDSFNTFANKPVVAQVVIENDSTKVTAGVDPTYTIVIPAKIDFGKLAKSMPEQTQPFSVKIQDAMLENGKKVTVNVLSNFVMNDQTPGSAAVLPYKLFNTPTDGTELAGGALYCEFNSTLAVTNVDGRVTCLPSGLTNAGEYSGNLNFFIHYAG